MLGTQKVRLDSENLILLFLPPTLTNALPLLLSYDGTYGHGLAHGCVGVVGESMAEMIAVIRPSRAAVEN